MPALRCCFPFPASNTKSASLTARFRLRRRPVWSFVVRPQPAQRKKALRFLALRMPINPLLRTSNLKARTSNGGFRGAEERDAENRRPIEMFWLARQEEGSKTAPCFRFRENFPPSTIFIIMIFRRWRRLRSRLFGSRCCCSVIESHFSFRHSFVRARAGLHCAREWRARASEFGRDDPFQLESRDSGIDRSDRRVCERESGQNKLRTAKAGLCCPPSVRLFGSARRVAPRLSGGAR